MRCLEKDRTRRFQSIADLAAALVPLAPGEARAYASRCSCILRSSALHPALDRRCWLLPENRRAHGVSRARRSCGEHRAPLSALGVAITFARFKAGRRRLGASPSLRRQRSPCRWRRPCVIRMPFRACELPLCPDGAQSRRPHQTSLTAEPSLGRVPFADKTAPHRFEKAGGPAPWRSSGVGSSTGDGRQPGRVRLVERRTFDHSRVMMT
jgi:hypothetical protein